MIRILTSWWTPLWSRLSGAIGIIGGLFLALGAAWFKGRAEGRAEMKAAEARHRAEAQLRKRKIDDETDSLGHADLDSEFKRWVRQNDKQ